MTVERRQRYVRVRVRELVESDGEWGTPDKSWEAPANGTIRTLFSLTTIGGSRERDRMGAEYEADWIAVARARPEIKQGQLIETLDSNDNAIDRFIVQKVLARGPRIAILLRENPNIQS